MKKYLSVFSLITRESIYRLTLLWIVSAFAQLACLTYNFYIDTNNSKLQLHSLSVERLFQSWNDSHISFVFYISLILFVLLLVKTGMEFHSKTGYTLRRLRISENKVFILHGIYNSVTLLMFLVAEVFLFFIFVLVIKNYFPEEIISSQTLYKTFYRSDFIHGLFAGRDILRAVRNVFAMSALGFNLASFSTLIRRGKKWFPAVILIALFYFLYAEGAGLSQVAFDIIFTAISVVFLITSIIYTVTRGEQYDR